MSYLVSQDPPVNLFDAVKGHKMRPNFTTPLATIDAAKAWISTLHDAEMMFHFEDSPETIIKGRTDEPLFTKREAKHVRQRIAELYSLDWSTVGHECPIGYALEVMRHAEFTEAFFRAETHGGGTMGWEQWTADEKVKILITSSDGCSLDLSGPDDFFIVGAYSLATGDSVMDGEGVEDGGTSPEEAIAKAKEVAAKFGGF